MEHVAYFQPKNIKEYVELMGARSNDVTLIAGGTNLIPDVRNCLKTPKTLVDVGDIEELSGIRLEADGLSIGAAVTINDIAESSIIHEYCPILSKAASELGNNLTRNRATIGGNLSNASPCADTAPPLLALEAMIYVTDTAGKLCAVPIEKFFLGYRLTQLGPGDVMTRILVPLPEAGSSGGHTKLGLRKAASICVTSVALNLIKQNGFIAKARIAFGSVAPKPIRAYQLEAFLEGKAIEDTVLNECEVLLKKEIAPISDIRGSASYRQAATGAILKRNLIQAWS